MKLNTRIKNVEKIATRMARKEIERARVKQRRQIERFLPKTDMGDGVKVTSRGWA